MKIKGMVSIPAKIEEQVVEIRCDICGKKGSYSGNSVNWASEIYKKDETEVRWSYGDSFPECSSGSEYVFRICPTCFEKKLIPWLIEQGAKPFEEDWDY